MNLTQKYKRNFGRGWFFDSWKHGLAAKGIKTGRKYMLPKSLKKQMSSAPISVSSRVFKPYTPVEVDKAQIAKGSRYERVPGRLLRKHPDILKLQKETGATISFEAPGIHRFAAGTRGQYSPDKNHIVVFTEDSFTGEKYDLDKLRDITFHELSHAKRKDDLKAQSPLQLVVDHESEEKIADLESKEKIDTSEQDTEEGMKRLFQAQKLSPYDDVLNRMNQERMSVIRGEVKALREKVSQTKSPELQKALHEKQIELRNASEELGLPEVERDIRHGVRQGKKELREELLYPRIREIDHTIKKIRNLRSDEEISNVPDDFRELQRLVTEREELGFRIRQERRAKVQKVRDEAYKPYAEQLDAVVKGSDSTTSIKLSPDLQSAVDRKKDIDFKLSDLKEDVGKLKLARFALTARRIDAIRKKDRAIHGLKLKKLVDTKREENESNTEV